MVEVLEFDYIVVGAGAAGCVIANRLVMDGRFSVALVERGRTDSNRWIHIPATYFKAHQSEDIAEVLSEPDETLDGKRFSVPQGHVLGGGSSINAMVYMRGQARDYNDWDDDHGCKGWRYEDVLPVFMRQEKNIHLGPPYHGHEGQLVVASPEYKHPVNQLMLNAAHSAGVPWTDDFNGETQEGVGWYQATAYAGHRQSAATCFLKPVLGNEQLTVLTNAIAGKVRFNGRRATALEITKDGQQHLLSARKEIILTAGTFQSPKLLMLSGVGPASELDRHGIETVHDAPEVGSNYHDHVGTPVTYKLKNKKGYHNADKGFSAMKHGMDYFLFRRGMLTSNLLTAGACVDTDGGGRPDVQYNFAPFAPGSPGQGPLPFHSLHLHPLTMRPKSRGRLVLATTNPDDNPKLEAQVLQNEDDLDTLRRGVRFAREICEQPELKEILGEQIWPGPGISTAKGSNNFDDAIRKQARTCYHPTGTCRMGTDENAVTDARLYVNGIEGVRVADCSVMPAVISGNTNAPTMMIADRAADFVLEDA